MISLYWRIGTEFANKGVRLLEIGVWGVTELDD